MLKISRRDFLKSLGGLTVVSEKNRERSQRDIETPVLHQEKEVPVLCTACDRGCGVLATVRGGEVVGFEGDPDHPASQGFLCEEGESLFHLSTSKNKSDWSPHLCYKPAGGAAWEAKDWGWTLRSIALRIMGTGDAFLEQDSDKVKSICCVRDDSLLTNEEGYLLSKLCQALGVPVKNNGRNPGALFFRNFINVAGRPDASEDWTRFRDILMSTWYAGNSVPGLRIETLRPENALNDWLTSGNAKGLFIWGGGRLPHEPENEMINILRSVDWLVLIDWFKTREDFITKCGIITETCPKAEIFLLPAAAPWEKSGSLISAGRWVQWCTGAVEPREQVRTPLWMIDRLFKVLRDAYQEDGVSPERILKIQWDYAGNAIPDVDMVAAEMRSCLNEYDRVLSEQADPPAEGSMTCGLQLDTGYWGGKALSMRRSLDHERWGFLLPQ